MIGQRVERVVVVNDAVSRNDHDSESRRVGAESPSQRPRSTPRHSQISRLAYVRLHTNRCPLRDIEIAPSAKSQSVGSTVICVGVLPRLTRQSVGGEATRLGHVAKTKPSSANPNVWELAPTWSAGVTALVKRSRL